MYDDFILKITLWTLGLYKNISALQGLNNIEGKWLDSQTSTRELADACRQRLMMRSIAQQMSSRTTWVIVNVDKAYWAAANQYKYGDRVPSQACQ